MQPSCRYVNYSCAYFYFFLHVLKSQYRQQDPVARGMLLAKLPISIHLMILFSIPWVSFKFRFEPMRIGKCPYYILRVKCQLTTPCQR